MGGVYDVYVYAHGAADGQAPFLELEVVGGWDWVKMTAPGPGWQDGVFVEGVDYVVFRGVLVRGGEVMRLTVKGGAGGVAVLNGMQLVRVGGEGDVASTLIVPPAFATVEDDWYSHTLFRPLRLQQVYDRSLFPAVPIEVSGVRFRRDAAVEPFGSQAVRLRVTASATASVPDGLSGVWEENLGEGAQVVYDGVLVTSSLNVGEAGMPAPFDIEVPFERSFLYDPAAGNFLLEFVVTEGAGLVVVDSSNEYDDKASRVFALGPDAVVAEWADQGADVMELVYREVGLGCVAVGSGLGAWWRGEGDAYELVSLVAGVMHEGAGFGEGMVGQGFDLSVPGSHVRVADMEALRFEGELSVEAWVKPGEHMGLRDLVSKWDGVVGVDQRSFALSLDGEGVPYFIVSATGGHSVVGVVFATNTVVAVGEWSHVAGTYDGSYLSLYVNGELRGRVAYSGGIFPGAGDLGIGGTVGGMVGGQAISTFGGWIDEVSVYGRALSGGEVRSIWKAGVEGKCLPEAPAFVSGPVAVEGVEGGVASFSVTVLGTGPLGYQWWSLRDGLLEGEVGSTLSLKGLKAEDDGEEFYVVVSNFMGTVMSDVVRLTVRTLPRVLVHPVSVEVEQGGVASFAVSAGGAEPLTYRWRKDGVEIAGAGAPVLVLNGVDGRHEGWYDVVVSNPYGDVVSEEVWLGVVSGRLGVVRGGGGLRVQVSGEAGATYVVEWSVDLLVWMPLVTVFDAPAVWVVPDFVTSGEVERRFYRLRR
jgi:hypothetical protein